MIWWNPWTWKRTAREIEANISRKLQKMHFDLIRSEFNFFNECQNTKRLKKHWEEYFEEIDSRRARAEVEEHVERLNRALTRAHEDKEILQ